MSETVKEPEKRVRERDCDGERGGGDVGGGGRKTDCEREREAARL